MVPSLYRILPALTGAMICGCLACGASIPSLAQIIPTLIALEIPPPEVQYGLAFAQRGDKTLKLDVFLPADSAAPRPAVVLVHGGFWVFGEPWMMHDWAVDLTGQGYVAVTSEYRLLGEGGQFPAPVADVLAAVAYVRSRAADWNVDPDRIAILGESSGAHLALMAGLVSDASVYEPSFAPGESARARAIVEIYGPTDFMADLTGAQIWQVTLVTSFLGVSRDEAPQLWREASPVTGVRADGPPVLMLHGENDPTVPFTQAESLSAAMDAVGQPHQLVVMPDAEHGWDSQWIAPSVQEQRATILQFLREHLEAVPP